jgi:hypothetical protein
VGQNQCGGGLRRPACGGQPSLTHLAKAIEFVREREFGCVRRQISEWDFFDAALGESTLHRADIFLEAPDHDRIEVTLAHLDPANKPLRIENF